MTALLNDLLSWLSGRGSERRDNCRDGRQPAADGCAAARNPLFDEEAQAAAAAELKEEVADEKAGRAVRSAVQCGVQLRRVNMPASKDPCAC